MATPLPTLIIGDSEGDTLLITRELQRGGYEPETTRIATPDAMRKALLEKTPDVIICDDGVPDFGAIPALDILKETGLDIPFIVVSGAITSEMVVNILKSGAHDFLMKYNLRRLPASIAREIREAEARRERRRIERASIASIEKYTRIFEAAPDAIIISTRDEGRILEVNPGFTKLVGYSREEAVGHTSLELNIWVEPEERNRILKVLQERGTLEDYEITLRTRSGLVRTCLLSQSPITIDGNLCIVSIFNDITERIAMQKMLTASELNFRTSLNESPLGIRIVDINGNNLYVNQALLNIFGLGAIDEIEEKPVIDRYTPESRVLALERREQRLSGVAVPLQYEIEIIRKDGSSRSVEVFQKQVLWNGERQYQLLYYDITERKSAEKALRADERRYRSLFENMLNGFAYCKMLFEHDRPQDFIYLEVNKAFEIQTGLKNVTGKKVTEVIPGIRESDPHLFEIFGRAARTGVPETFETYLEALKMWFSISVYSPEKEYFVAVFDVITERKHAEENLRASEKNFRNSMDNSPISIRIVDKDGNALYANQAMLDVYGYDNLQELEATPTAERYTPESYMQHRERVAKRQRGEPMPNEHEISIVRKNGAIRNLHVFRKEVMWGGTKQYQVLYNDITERKQAEIALEESRARFMELADLLPQPVWEIDTTGTITYSNAEGIRSHGYKWGDPINASQLFIPQDRERVKRNLDGVLSGQKLNGIEYTALRKDGSTFPVLVYAAPVISEGKIIGVRGITVDITERKESEQKTLEVEMLRGVDRLRSEFLANVSHELRTPLTAIKGYSSSLLRTDVRWKPAQVREFLTTIDSETDRLAALINDLLDMSRIDAGLLKLNRRTVAVGGVIDSIVDRLKTMTANHELVVRKARRLPSVDVDENRIGQVITNLIDNAVKFSPPGSEIIIQTKRDRDTVVVSVTDHGIGIPGNLHAKIFDRFYQAESAVTGKKSGTGLGLAICRGLIEGHGGKIWVESEPVKGSTFSFSLPVKKGGKDA